MRPLPVTIAKCYDGVNSILPIPACSSLLSNAGMDASEARHANLLDLERQLGTLEALAAKAGVSSGYLSQIKNKHKGRGMGKAVARRIEKKLDLPKGWMDTRDHAPMQKVIGATTLVADFEVLPPALQDHVSNVARELREQIEALSPEMRKVISAPPKDPERYAEWERSIRELIAAQQRYVG